MSSSKRMKKKSVIRQQYTLADQKKILTYVISQRDYYYLRGNRFWQQMEKKGIIDRTWQSVKEHFRKRIMENLHLYNLSPKDSEALKEGWISTSKAVKDRYGNPSKRPKYKQRRDFSDDDNYEIDSDESLPLQSIKTNNKNVVNQPIILSDSNSDAIVALTPKKIQLVAEESLDSDITADLDIPDLQKNDTPFTEIFSPCSTSTQISPKKSATASKWISGKHATEKVSSYLDEAAGFGRITNERSDISLLVEKYFGNTVAVGKASGSKPKTEACRNQKVFPNLLETPIKKVSVNVAEKLKVSANSVAPSDSLLFPPTTLNKNVSPIAIIATSSSGRMSKVSPQNYKTCSNSSDNSPDTTVLLRSPPSKSANAVNEVTNQLSDISLDLVPTVSGFMSTSCPRCSKNSSQDEEIIDDTLENSNATISSENDRFSKKEDIDLLTFITDNKKMFQNRNNIAVYECYKQLHGSLRSPRTLRKRFLKNIFPNIDTAKEETWGKDTPNNLENRPPDRITSDKGTQTDTSSNLIIKDDLSKLTQCVRKALLDNCGEFIKACLSNENDLDAIISKVEICLQPFISDESSAEDSNSNLVHIKQENCSFETSSLHLDDSISNLVQLKQENCSFEHNSSHKDEHNYCRRFVKEENPSPCSTEMLDTSLESCQVPNVLGKFEAHLPDSPEMPTILRNLRE